jgi:hypothetical protein
MKKINTYIIALLSIVSLAGCEEFLDTKPEGGTITEEQKGAAAEANPELLSADVAAMYANMIAYCSILSGTRHNDFGYAAACLFMDSNGADMTCADIGYSWFRFSANYTDRVYTSEETDYMWKLFYKQIASANILLASIDPEATDPSLQAYRGQALAVRAFDYLHLAQLHQFTYKGHEQAKCVPIVTENTTTEEATNNPRATVEAVYELILDDLDNAIALLKGYKRIDKSYIDQSVAYGLRARANLVKNEWAAAAADADSALTISGATPYTLEQASTPLFYDANDKNVLWANIVTENNDIVQSGIINAPSHLCSFFTDGYISVGAWKKINKPLFDKINSNDIRKQWWLNEDLQSDLVKHAVYDKWREIAEGEGDFGPYTNVKFGPDGGTAGLTNLVPAQDWFLMRAEELILIKAEGLAKSGGNGKAELEKFVNNYRWKGSSPYSVTSDLLEEIWFQRRIELWGEGFSFFDIMRLKTPVTRIDNGETSFPAAQQFNIPAEDPVLLWLVPKSEIEANAGISESDNNAKVPAPKP